MCPGHWRKLAIIPLDASAFRTPVPIPQKAVFTRSEYVVGKLTTVNMGIFQSVPVEIGQVYPEVLG